MNRAAKHKVHRFYILLREAMPILIFLMLIFFGAAIIGFMKDNQRLLQDTKHITEDTQTIVSKQDETLVAIKDLSLDNKLTSKQLGDTIICMLLVPVNQRTTETQDQCRQGAITRTPPSTANGSTTSQPVQPTPVGSPQPTPTPQPGMVERLNTRVEGVLESVDKFIRIIL